MIGEFVWAALHAHSLFLLSFGAQPNKKEEKERELRQIL